MGNRRRIRGELVANREAQATYRARVNREAFGIYRPLTSDCAMHVRDVLFGAREEANNFLKKRRRTSADLVIPGDLGATFLMRNKVWRVMKFGLLQRGFELGRMVQSLEDHNPTGEVRLEVPIEEVGWYGTDRRKLVIRFEQSTDATRELGAQAEIVEQLLNAANASDLPVHEPDHVSVVRYGRPGDRLDLSSRHRDDVAGIFEEHFIAAGIGSLALGRLILGESYSRPLHGHA